jgi:fructan beta-fructosidase
MMLFPTEFRLVTTSDGLRMRAMPIHEIEALHGKHHSWTSLTVADTDQKLREIPPGPLHIKMNISLPKDGRLALQYQGMDLVGLSSADFDGGRGSVEVLIDKAVAEVFVNGGRRYVVRELPASNDRSGLSVHAEGSAAVDRVDVYEMKSMWGGKA